MSDNTLVRQSARELARLIRTRAASPLDVLDAHLAAIKALNPKLNAVVTLAEEQARDNAQRAEQAVMKGEPLGALHGLPVGIKDITQTAGIRTTFASPLLKDNVPSEDEESCAAGNRRRDRARQDQYARIRLRRQHQQCVVRADAQSVESGAQSGRLFRRLRGCGRDRHDALAQGTDYGCSIRIPAAFCGIVGIRPTPGLIPSYPKPLAGTPARCTGRWRATRKMLR